MPRTSDELEDVMKLYRAAGFPGCAGSVDVVHIRHDMSPFNLKNVNTGKEGYPSLAFEVIADHTRRVRSCTRGFPGSFNDKSIMRFDSAVRAMRVDPLFSSVEWEYLDVLGAKHTRKGAYLLSDNGYTRTPTLVMPVKFDPDLELKRWSEMCESLRKDVECTFGILKGRWRILKAGIRMHGVAIVEQIMKTCCVLHNMLIHYDGLDMGWLNGDDAEFSCEDHWAVTGQMLKMQGVRAAKDALRNFDLSFRCDHAARASVQLDCFDDRNHTQKHFELREVLSVHFTKSFRLKQIIWPTRRVE